MRLAIVIPAYNEEQAIRSIIERTLAARDVIIERSPVNAVCITVVSDGSTDRTAQIVREFAEISVIEFERNRGYGAAIKRGFAETDSELVAFLDADGTCDPQFFADLCNAIVEDDADVAIGSRMSAESRMPRLRRFGNRIYAIILSALSNKVVTDTASGMRVIRRTAIERLYPLPDGLHFTPAMSARVLMDQRLKIVERAMPYEERIGESKLHVVRDGVRFLRTIFEMSLMWRPGKMFAGCAFVCFALMFALGLHPLEMWLATRHLQEDMIYRLLFCAFIGTVGSTLLSAAALSEQLNRLWDEGEPPRTFTASIVDRLFTPAPLFAALAVSLPLLGWLIGPGIWTRIIRGVVEVHWSRVVLAGLIAFALAQMLVTTLLLNLVRFHAARRETKVDHSFAGQRNQIVEKKRAASLLPATRHYSHEPYSPPGEAAIRSTAQIDS